MARKIPKTKKRRARGPSPRAASDDITGTDLDKAPREGLVGREKALGRVEDDRVIPGI